MPLLRGVTGRWPGAPSMSVLQMLLSAGGDAVGQVPSSRWSPSGGVTDHGAFLMGAENFDNACFGISLAEASAMDPQQRLLLECGYTSLHAAEQQRESLHASNVGVFLGMMNTDFDALQADCNSAYAATGGTISIAAGRLSFVLGVTGPCLSLDTACSSALVALHSATLSLRSNECSTALALAVSLMLSPKRSVAYNSAGMLSSDGRCKTFDRRANGYVRGEGVGAVVLSTEFTGDSSLQGSSVRSDGRSASLTAPNGVMQTAMLREAMATVVHRIGIVEAHGTGTANAQPIVEGPGAQLERSLINSRDGKQLCGGRRELVWIQWHDRACGVLA